MRRVGSNIFTFSLISLIVLLSWTIPASVDYGHTHGFDIPWFSPPDTTVKGDTSVVLPFPPPKQDDYLLYQPEDTGGLYLRPPKNFKTEVEYDPSTNQYYFRNKIGDLDYRNPTYMSFDEYQEYELDNTIKQYWRERSSPSSTLTKDGIIPSLYIGGQVFDRIFGSNTIDIRPQGSAELSFGVLANRRDDPSLNVRQQRTTNFDFEQNIQMNVMAKIGDKIQFNTNFNTEAVFDFENKLKLNYEGKEDEIIKLIEAGNVSMPLSTTLITGTQSLFGFKTKLQFGRTTVTGLFSEQESESSTVVIENGKESNRFELKATDYEENKHFFISHLFRESYDKALAELPIVASDINITRIEVWVTNIGPAIQQNRNLIAFQDLGEFARINNPNVNPIPGRPYPSNNSNNLLQQLDVNQLRSISSVGTYLSGDPFSIGYTGYMVNGEDYEKIESARKLETSEYSVNSKLGFISLYTTLNPDQSLAVAFQYTVIGVDSVFQVGEFSDQTSNTSNCLVVKLLKSTSLSTQVPMWDLMMKNVYSIGAYRVSRDKFILNILYSGNSNGVPTGYFTEGPEGIKGTPLIQFFNLDNLDQLLNPPPDGLFDFIDNAAVSGGTMNSSNGRLYFTVIEPFGKFLRNKFGPGNTDLANKYAFDTLYRSTKTIAEQQTEKNKYLLEGFYSSESGAEIDLNAFNIPRGSVKVTAGGRTLTENVDYTVDYTLGRVRIINEGILNSGLPINITNENQSTFNVLKKRMMGLRVDHQIGKDIRFGGTLLNLTERPLTQKVDYGNDPISNTIWGLDGSYQGESRLITSIVDKLPGIETKAPSKVNVEGEFASFMPGHSKAIGKSGVVYIDDFEGAKSTIDLRNVGTWFLASTPQGQPDLFPEASGNDRSYGFNRAKAAWYTIDPLFYDRNNNLRPANISRNELARHSVREVLETEVFPNKEIPNGIPTNIPVFNLAFYPSERGPYNYDVDGLPGISAGIGQDGSLIDPASRWGGIMRKIESSDFEATNVEYIEFWMMDPFNSDAEQNNPGRLYINLGDISEDILKDGRKFYENGLPTSEIVTDVDTTIWGRVPTLQNLVESFDNNPASRPFQDVGYDGLRNEDERDFYGISYIDRIEQVHGTASIAYFSALEDPSADDYNYFRDSDYDNDDKYSTILERYKKYNGPDGNSPTDSQNDEEYPTSATAIPNVEDLNRDNTLSEAERYFQYVIDLDPNKMEVGENFITDIRTAKGVPLANGTTGEVNWYQFKVPVAQPSRVVGNISDFKSIRFLRMFMKDFEKPVTLRFATLELVRGEWRRYKGDLLSAGEYIPDDIQSLTTFDIFSVNIEENGRRQPVPYVLPPGLEREQNIGTTTLVRLNEQSMVLKVCDLIDGDSRAAYKTTDFDFRQYKNLEMFVHAEKSRNEDVVNDGDLTVFVRIGSDFTENYYEYEVPMTFTPWGTPPSQADVIWPESNRFNIDLEKLVQVKLDRDIAARNGESNVSVNFPYVRQEGPNRITVLGVPSVSDVMAIMVGVRNPKRQSLTGEDDGLSKCAEIWINELRLTGFNDKAGWAGLIRVNSQLGDIGQVVFSTMYSSPNFASLEKKINDTQKESHLQWDIATDLNLGKFLPEEAGVRIPMHIDYSQTIETPEYDPLSPDLKLKDELASYENKEEADSIRDIVQDYTDRFNINFMNVRKDRVGAKKKPQFYDVENFSVSYAYTMLNMRNIDIEYDKKETHNGGLAYNFNIAPKNIKPFQNIGFISKSEFLKLFKDFNFYFLPKQFGFRTDMMREEAERKLRNKSEGLILLRPTFARKWDWNRLYDLKFDLATSLTLQYRASVNSFLREPSGSLDPNSPWYDKAGADTIDVGRQFWQGGLRRNYNQTLDITYRIPIDKLPMMDWVTAQATYGTIYNWIASPLSVQQRLGNVIENSRNIQLSGNVDLTKLYGKVPYLKKLGQSAKPDTRGRSGTVPKQQPPPQEEQDSVAKPNYFKKVADEFLKFVMMVKRGSITYSESTGTLIPGFMPSPQALGVDWGLNAPGLGFAFGSQKDIRSQAVQERWLTYDTLQNQAYANKFTSSLNARVSLEPFQGFKIEINADRTFARNHTEYFRADSSGVFDSYSPQDAGSFSMSYITWGTAFHTDYDTSISATFEEMKRNRYDIAMRLAAENPNSNAMVYDSLSQQYYPLGYGPTSQDVLIPAFLAAYGNKSTTEVYLGYFPSIPLPNWRVTYDGLTKIKFLQKFIKSAVLSHSYRSVYTISSYQSNLYYGETDGKPSALYEASNSYYPKYDLNQVTIQEQFAPVVGIDITLNNSLLTRFEFRKARTLTFSMINKQLTDLSTDEYVIGLGYRIKDVSFTVSSLGGGGRKTQLKSDLDIKVDFSIRNNRTVLRRIDENIDQVSAGQRVYSINTSIDYMLSKSVTLRLFYDMIINRPFVANQYDNSTTRAGISIRFSLAQ
ncbi:MAG: cell surface protein SprA [Bacteroidales bacterium]|nr:cell surface protein SprA [Bacteroidales bacterium]